MSSSWLDRLRHTLGFRLALWYALVFVAGSALLGVLTYALLDSSLEHRDHELIRATLDRYVGEYRRRGLPGLNDAIATDRVAGRHERLFVRVLGRGAEAVFLNTPSDWQGADLARLAPDSTGWAQIPARGAGAVLEVASVQLPDGTLFQVGKSSEGREELLLRFRALSALLLGSTVAIGIVGGVALTWSALRPVRELAAAVRRIMDTGKMSARVPVGGNRDPLDELSRLFNGMLDRIETLVAGLEASLDNVAHDLRTPLARLRASAETALARGGDAEACREALADCLEESERVHETLTSLLDISEAEHGAMRLRHDRIDLPGLLKDAAVLYEDLAEDKGIALAVRAPAGLEVTGDRPRLRQVLANLLDNAVKYVPRGGHVELTAAARPGGVAIEVKDDGPGIPKDEQPRVFDRLYRGDRSRSERGLGLGLSLVRAVVQAHGGTVSVRSEPGAGATFRVDLPDAPPFMTQL
jgi:signal transduction histidine kinase